MLIPSDCYHLRHHRLNNSEIINFSQYLPLLTVPFILFCTPTNLVCKFFRSSTIFKAYKRSISVGVSHKQLAEGKKRSNYKRKM